MTDRERVDRFEAAYNRIDHALEEIASRDRHNHRRTFASKVRIASDRVRRLARYKDFLLEIGELRNAIVHNRTGEDHFLAIPSDQTIAELEEIEKQIFSPPGVFPRFARAVVTLRPDQSLAEAWQLIRDDGYSRYPVYDGGGFVGLLTSNGFARWCAGQMNNGVLHVDTSRVNISDVLDVDHRRDAVAFVSRNALIDDVDATFKTGTPIEAVIITEHGRPTERPLGMICPIDLVGVEGDGKRSGD